MKRKTMKELREQAKKLVSESESDGFKEKAVEFIKSIGGLE